MAFNQSINQSFILTRYVKELKKSIKMRACKLLHDLKKLFILMFFFFNYFFFHPLNNIVVSAYSVFIDLLDNSTFNILLPTFVANITFAHDSFEHEAFWLYGLKSHLTRDTFIFTCPESDSFILTAFSFVFLYITLHRNFWHLSQKNIWLWNLRDTRF